MFSWVLRIFWVFFFFFFFFFPSSFSGRKGVWWEAGPMGWPGREHLPSWLFSCFSPSSLSFTLWAAFSAQGLPPANSNVVSLCSVSVSNNIQGNRPSTMVVLSAFLHCNKFVIDEGFVHLSNIPFVFFAVKNLIWASYTHLVILSQDMNAQRRGRERVIDVTFFCPYGDLETKVWNILPFFSSKTVCFHFITFLEMKPIIGPFFLKKELIWYILIICRYLNLTSY